MKAGKAVAKRPSTTITVGGPGANMRTESNAIPYLAPGAFALVLWGLALIERRLFRTDEYVWFWSTFVFAIYGLAALFAWRISQRHPLRLQLVITGAIAVMGLWSWYFIGVPEQTWRLHVVYWMAALLIWGCSVMWLANKGTGDGGQNVLDDVGGAVSKIQNVSAVTTNFDTGEVKAAVRMRPGTPAAELAKDGSKIAALLPGVRPAGVRILPSKDDATLSEMTVSPVDRLAVPPPWTGPSIPEGGTCDDPVRLGVRATGGWSEFWLSADPATMRTAPIVVIVAMAGAGKTVLLSELAIEILSRADTGHTYWLGDPRKFHQLPRWMRDAAERTADDRKSVAKMIKDFADDVPARAKLIGGHGCSVWTSACCWRKHGITNRVMIIDEAAGVASEIDDIMVNLTESVRSVGSVPVFAFQRGTGDRFPTSARSNVNTYICGGVRDEDDAVHGGLPDDVLDAGAAPWLWQANQPGMHILAAPGVPEDLRAVDCRTFDTRDASDLMRQWAEHFMAMRKGRRGAAPAVRETAGQGNPDTTPTVVGLADDDDPATVSAVTEAQAALDDDLGAEGDTTMAAIVSEISAAVHPDDATDMARMTGGEPLPTIPPPPGDEIIATQPRMSSPQARAALYRYLLALARRGTASVRPVDVIEWVTTDLGMRKTWLYQALEAFTADSETGQAILRQTDNRGPYEIIAPHDQRAIGGDAT